MKNKLLKTLGIGALVGLGALTFAGCSLNKDEANVNNISKEEAYVLCKLGYKNILLNYNGIRDNLEISIDYDSDGVNDETIISYSSNNNDVFIQDSEGFNTVLYEYNDNCYYYSKEGSDVSKEILEGELHGHTAWNSIDLISQMELTELDIVKCEVLDNGNYLVKYMVDTIAEEDNYMAETIIDIEITADGNYVKQEVYNATTDLTTYNMYFTHQTLDFEYGNVDVDYVNEKLAEAKAVELTN